MSQEGAVTGEERRLLRGMMPFWGLVALLLLIRWGTFDAGPTWDPAMSIWSAAIEVHRGHTLLEVLAMPSFGEGGPNTHTLSLVSVLTMALVSAGNLTFAIVVMHLLNFALLVGVGYVTARIARYVGAGVPSWVVGGAVMLFPVMVGQSAYLYTELPAAFFVLLSLLTALRGQVLRSVLALILAVLIKPLAVVAIPALGVLIWRKVRSGRLAVAPLMGLPGLLPYVLVASSDASLGPSLERLSETVEVSIAWAIRAPEISLLMVSPVLVFVVMDRLGASDRQWSWFWGTSVLLGSFALFFALNGFMTAGHFFLPRYAVMWVAPVVIVLASAVPQRHHRLGLMFFGLLIALSLVGSRGPFSLGHTASLPPLAERSLSFLDLASEHREGFAELAALGSSGVPIFGDHYAGFAFSYPELGLYPGSVENATTVRSGSWGESLNDLPDEFAMLHYLPFLGGERLLRVRFLAEADPGFTLSVISLGTRQPIPVEIVIVRNLDEGG